MWVYSVIFGKVSKVFLSNVICLVFIRRRFVCFVSVKGKEWVREMGMGGLFRV